MAIKATGVTLVLPTADDPEAQAEALMRIAATAATAAIELCRMRDLAGAALSDWISGCGDAMRAAGGCGSKVASIALCGGLLGLETRLVGAVWLDKLLERLASALRTLGASAGARAPEETRNERQREEV